MNAFDRINTYKDKVETVAVDITEEEAEIIEKLMEKNLTIDYAKFILKRRDSIAANINPKMWKRHLTINLSYYTEQFRYDKNLTELFFVIKINHKYFFDV